MRTIEELVERAGGIAVVALRSRLTADTVRSCVRGDRIQRQARTIEALAEGLGVSAATVRKALNLATAPGGRK